MYGGIDKGLFLYMVVLIDRVCVLLYPLPDRSA